MSTAQIHYDSLQNADLMWHLKQSRLLEGLSASELTDFASRCRDRLFEKQEVIYQQGDAAGELYLLNRGCVRLSVVNDDLQEKILDLISTGDVFGTKILQSDGRYESQAVAHEECWVSVLPNDELLDFMAYHPSVAMNFIRLLEGKLADAREDIEALSFLDTESRVARTLVRLGLQHGRSLFSREDFVKLRFPISHEYLAQLIGGNRPHVSTIMSRLKKKGFLSYQGRKLLLNLERLKKIAARD